MSLGYSMFSHFLIFAIIRSELTYFATFVFSCFQSPLITHLGEKNFIIHNFAFFINIWSMTFWLFRCTFSDILTGPARFEGSDIFLRISSFNWCHSMNRWFIVSFQEDMRCADDSKLILFISSQQFYPSHFISLLIAYLISLIIIRSWKRGSIHCITGYK